jgi:hypothetical protein
MDADTKLEILKDIIAGNEHKHSASDRHLADLADTARNSSKLLAGD